MKGPYTVTLLDHDGCALACDEHETIAAARNSARMYITDSEYADAGVFKVEVRDTADVCVFDIFPNQVAA